MTKRIIPFPGLRPFAENEEHLFFGRESQVDAMVDKLAASRFLAVVGSSGSGKSSLVNCGLRPALQRGLLASAGTSWKITKFRPGKDPMRAMARALAADGFLLKDFGGGFSLEEVVDTHLRVSKRGLLEIYRRARLPDHVNLLIIVDQFEEIFRYAPLAEQEGQSARSEAIAFINLLLEPSTQRELPIYVAITMRSDFLGDCTQFPGLPDAINRGQYLVPRMSRDDRRRAIRGPVGVGQAEISPVLLTRLVNDVGDNPDQLSILQHALNRTWMEWSEPGEGQIELEHYEKTGSMAAALNNHAEEAYARLENDRQRHICEKLFQAISDTGTDARGIRRPTVLSDICAIASASITEVKQVIEFFRDSNSSFLMPPPPEELEADTVIDISHESLMRVWKRLMEWTRAEAADAERYRRLARTAVLHEQGNAELLAGAELELMLKWRGDVRPNAAWAERYHSGFEKVDAFLDASKLQTQERVRIEQEEQQNLSNLEDKLQKEKLAASRRKFLYGALALVMLASVLSAFFTKQLLSERTTENEELKVLQAELKEQIKLREAALAEAEERAVAITEAVKAESTARVSEENVFAAEQELDRLKLLNDDAKVASQEKILQQAKENLRRTELVADHARSEAAIRAVGGNIIQMQDISYLDVFDISQGARVTAESKSSNGSRIFGDGARNWSEDGVTFFEDGLPANSEHWIEWQTQRPVSLESVHLFAIHDDANIGYRFRRAINNFKLFVKKDGKWDQVITYSPTLPYGGDATGREDGTALAVSLQVPSGTTGDEFRAVFTQAVNILGQFSGPRIVELDGYEESDIGDLINDMSSTDQKKRKSATQNMKNRYGSDPQALAAALARLTPIEVEALTPQALGKMLYVVANSNPNAWPPELITEAKQSLKQLKSKGVGPQTSEQLADMKLFLNSLKKTKEVNK